MFIEGISLNEGIELLRKHTSEVVWCGKSLFLVAGCAPIFPNFRFYNVTQNTLSNTLNNTPSTSGERRVALTFEPSDALQQWCVRNGMDLLSPQPKIIQKMGNKHLLDTILKRAGINPISAAVYKRGCSINTREIWAKFQGAPLVAQLERNNLSGAGTRFIANQEDLSSIFKEWNAEDIKITQYIPGKSLTISGCVGQDRTIISGTSLQLVGLTPLTPLWGRHCGNQLVSLAPDIHSRCVAICQRVGDELRRCGFLGLFGLDLVETPMGEVFVIEINPRIQSVSSLLNIAEIQAGLLPLPGVHLLSFLLQTLPTDRKIASASALLVSQLVLYADHGGRMGSALASGCYSLRDGSVVKKNDFWNFDQIGLHECIAWPFVEKGESVQAGDRLAILQFRMPVLDGKRELSQEALMWIKGFRRTFDLTE
jgi:hypothetical protein